MKVAYKSQLMRFSLRPDTCSFWISTSPGQYGQLIALESLMDLWSRRDGGEEGRRPDSL